MSPECLEEKHSQKGSSECKDPEVGVSLVGSTNSKASEHVAETRAGLPRAV